MTDKLNDAVAVGSAVAANAVSGWYSVSQYMQETLSFLTIAMNFFVALIGLYIVIRKLRAPSKEITGPPDSNSE